MPTMIQLVDGSIPIASDFNSNFSALNNAIAASVAGIQTTPSRLTYVNATTIQLGVGVIPLKAGTSWTLQPVTAAITVSNATLAASTTYFVYAYASGSGALLDTPSATGHAPDTTWGVETKSGDATRTL